MTKDEMKDKISMALKDPVLQQGFEIICKENAELKSQIEKMKCDMFSLVKDGMNDDIDQNTIERLAERWEILDRKHKMCYNEKYEKNRYLKRC